MNHTFNKLIAKLVPRWRMNTLSILWFSNHALSEDFKTWLCYFLSLSFPAPSEVTRWSHHAKIPPALRLIYSLTFKLSSELQVSMINNLNVVQWKESRIWIDKFVFEPGIYRLQSGLWINLLNTRSICFFHLFLLTPLFFPLLFYSWSARFVEVT